MDVDEFEDHVDRLGEDVSAWPEPARSDARALLRRSSEARAIVADAAALRRAFSAAPAPRASDALKSRILAAARESETLPAAPVGPGRGGAPAESSARGLLSRLGSLFGSPLRPAVAMVLSICFLLGLTTGLLTQEPQHHAGSGSVASSLLMELF